MANRLPNFGNVMSRFMRLPHGVLVLKRVGCGKGAIWTAEAESRWPDPPFQVQGDPSWNISRAILSLLDCLKDERWTRPAP
jgi:hypothetical protein